MEAMALAWAATEAAGGTNIDERKSAEIEVLKESIAAMKQDSPVAGAMCSDRSELLSGGSAAAATVQVKQEFGREDSLEQAQLQQLQRVAQLEEEAKEQ